MPEFLKALFGDKSLTYDELKAAVDAAKDIKVANLASGQYVDKSKFDGVEGELTTAKNTITTLKDTVKKFDGVDVEALKNAVATTETQYKGTIEKMRRDNAITLALVQAKARDPQMMAAALIANEKIVLNADGTLGGLDVAALQKDKPWAFDVEQKKDEGTGHKGGDKDNNQQSASLFDAVRLQLESQK
jgi:hypothetical protein